MIKSDQNNIVIDIILIKDMKNYLEPIGRNENIDSVLKKCVVLYITSNSVVDPDPLNLAGSRSITGNVDPDPDPKK